MTEREKTHIQLDMVQRAEKLGVLNNQLKNPKFTLLLDIDNSIPKEALDILKNFSDEDFGNDIIGIQLDMDRKLYKPMGGFTPKCIQILEEKRNIGRKNN